MDTNTNIILNRVMNLVEEARKAVRANRLGKMEECRKLFCAIVGNDPKKVKAFDKEMYYIYNTTHCC